MEKQLKTIHTALVLAQLDTHSREISDQRATIEASISMIPSNNLHEILDVRKTELIGQLHQMIQRKLATQRDQMETIQAQLNGCIQFVNE